MHDALVVREPQANEEETMYNTIKTRIQQTKQFVRQHPTASACLVTAAITHRVTKNATMKAVLDETTKLAYGWGREAGFLNTALEESLQFIREQGLEHEFSEFANMVTIKP
jgi:hypothetical protein